MNDPVSLRHRLEFLGLSLGQRSIQALPYCLIRYFANAVGALAWAVDARGRSVAEANLRAAFGEEMTAARRRAVARASYGTFARTMMELCWSPRLTRATATRIVQIEGFDTKAPHHQPGVAGIYTTPHFSNFEWVAQISSFLLHPGPVIAQRFGNPLLGAIFDHLRSCGGNWVLPQERSMIRMLKFLREGGKFGMLTDLTLDPKEGSVAITQFGGLRTSVTQMHAALAKRTGARIVPCICRPSPSGGYVIAYHSPVEFDTDTPPALIAQRTWDAVEPTIRKYPEAWLWAYKHWRFRPSQGDTSRYPAYANPAKRFDRLLRLEKSQT